MGYFTLANVGVLIVAYTVYSVVVRVIDWWQFRQFSIRNGCKPPAIAKNKLPWSLEIIFYLISFKGDLLDDFILRRHKEIGTTYLIHGINGWGGQTIDPKNIQTILALKFNDWQMGKIRRGNFERFLGEHGIFTSDGKQWEHSRTMMRPQFSREQVSHLTDMEKHMKNFLAAVPVNPATGWTDEVDLMDRFYRFTIDTSTEFLFGESIDSQKEGIAERDLTLEVKDDGKKRIKDSSSTRALAGGKTEKEMGFSEAFTFAQDFTVWRFRLSSLYWLYNTSQYRAACDTVHNFTDQFVSIALNPATRAKRSQSTTSDSSQPQKFVLLEELAAKTQDPKYLRDQLLQILLAGRDTTAGLLSWVFYLLPRHPAVLAKLREEISQVFGDDASDTENMTFENLKNLKYLRYVLNESLRLFPIVPVNARVASRNTVLPVGGGPDGLSPVAIKKGWPMTYCVYGMQRRKDIWGEDALEFKPERWDGRRVGWEFLPFNGGPRICLGQQYALSEASFVIVRLLQSFTIFEPTESPVIAPKDIPKTLTITIQPEKGVKVRMMGRKL